METIISALLAASSMRQTPELFGPSTPVAGRRLKERPKVVHNRPFWRQAIRHKSVSAACAAGPSYVYDVPAPSRSIQRSQSPVSTIPTCMEDPAPWLAQESNLRNYLTYVSKISKPASKRACRQDCRPC